MIGEVIIVEKLIIDVLLLFIAYYLLRFMFSEMEECVKTKCWREERLVDS